MTNIDHSSIVRLGSRYLFSRMTGKAVRVNDIVTCERGSKIPYRIIPDPVRQDGDEIAVQKAGTNDFAEQFSPAVFDLFWVDFGHKSYSKVRRFLSSLNSAGVLFEVQVNGDSYSLSDGRSWTTYHVFIVVQEQHSKRWAANTIGRLCARSFYVSWGVTDIAPGATIPGHRNGAKFLRGHVAGLGVDGAASTLKSAKDALWTIRMACERI